METRPLRAAGRALLVFGLALPCCTFAVFAEGDPPDVEESPKATFEATVSVTSSLPELVSGQEVPNSELAGGRGADLAEQIRAVPGLNAVRRGSINLEPSLRGLQEEQIAILVDGTRTFAAGPARMDSNLSHVGVHAADGLRIVKGPFALAWGAGALSAIDLRTHRPGFDEPISGAVGLQYGENGERSDVNAFLRGGGERLYYSLSAARRDGADFEDGDGTEIPGDYASTEARWRLGARLNNRTTLDYSGGYQEQSDIDYPGRLLDATYFYARSHALELLHSGDRAEMMLQLYTNRKDHLMNNDEKPSGRDMPGRIPPFALDIDLPTESNTAGGRFRLDFAPRGETSWSAGADYYLVEQTASRTISRRSNGFVIFRDIVWPDAETEDLGGWVQLTHRAGKARLGATLRLDSVDATAGETSDFFRANVDGDLDQSETHVSAAVSAAIELKPNWTLETGVGRAVRTATTLERYSDRFPATKFQIAAEFMGNPELDPETSHELNVGMHYRAAKLTASVEGFYRQIDDYITITPDTSLPTRLPLSPPTVFRYINGDRASFYGAELRLDHRVHERFTWRADLSWLRGTDDELDEPVLGVTPLRLRASGRFEAIPNRLFVDASMTYTDDQDRVATSRFEQPTDGATVFDLGVELAFDDLTLEFDVLNLSDETYASHLNAPSPFTGQRIHEIGRSVRAGVRYRY